MRTSVSRGVHLARSAAFLLATVLPRAAQDGAGFRQYAGGFAGTFEDLLQRRLVLESSDEQTFRGLDSPSRIAGPTRPGGSVYDVESSFGPRDARQTLHQTWVIERRGLPCLRIIQPLEGGGNLVWYGPAAFGSEDEQRWISMKALGVGGVAWRWKRNNLASLLLPEDPAQEEEDR